MVDDFKTFFIIWKTKESTLCLITWNLDQKILWFIGVSSSELQKEQRSEETILNLTSVSFKYKTLFKILYRNIRRLVLIVTRRGIRYIHFHSISVF